MEVVLRPRTHEATMLTQAEAVTFRLNRPSVEQMIERLDDFDTTLELCCGCGEGNSCDVCAVRRMCRDAVDALGEALEVIDASLEQQGE